MSRDIMLWFYTKFTSCHFATCLSYPTQPLGVGAGYIGFTLSVCPSVCLLTFRVRPVASTVQDGFFPYSVQMINSMRGCVACDDLWPWPISSRSFGLDLENRVRSVASTGLGGSFYIWHKWSLSLEGVSRVTFCSESGNFNFWQIFEIFRPWPWKKIPQFSMDSFHIEHKWLLV